MKKSLKILVYLFFISLYNYAQVKDISLSQFSVNEGLSQSTVTYIFQDSKGFIWIGTGDGLNKFDGYEFTQYHHLINDSNSLTHSTIRSICEDKMANIWVGTEDGYNKIDVKTGKVKRFYIIDKTKTDPSARIFCINKKLYLLTRSTGLWSISASSYKATLITNNKNYCTDLRGHAISENIFWFSNLNKGQIECFNALNNSLKTIKLPLKYKDEIISTIRIKNKNEILLLSPHYFINYHIKNNTCKEIFNYKTKPFNNNLFLTFNIDSNFKYWIGVKDKGVYYYDKQLKLIRAYDTLFSNQGSNFHFKNPIVLYNDVNRNNWLGTDGNGLIKISPHKQKFKYYNLSQLSNYKGESNIIRSIYKDSSQLVYVGIYQAGLFVFDKERKSGKWYNIQINNSSINSSVTKIHEFGNSQILIGLDKGMLIYDKNSRKISESKLFEKLKNLYITNIINKDDKHVLIGTNNGLFLYNGIILTKLDCSGINEVSAIFVLDTNHILLSERNNNFFKISIKNNVVTKVQPNILPKFLKNSWLNYNCFVKDKNNTLWIASEKGLFEYDSLINYKTLLGIENGLPSSYCYSVIYDNNHKLWISTNNGISCFDISSRKFINYSLADGLQAHEFNTGAYFQSSDGEIFMGGVEGFNSFYPNQIVPNSSLPKINLTKFYLFDQQLNIDSINFFKILSFPYYNNTFTFEVCGNEYTNSLKNEYSFFLKGNDEKWIFQGNKRNIRYTSLKDGNYVLWVKASNNDGLWSQPIKLLDIEIKPPFWQKLWFQVVFIFLLISIIVLIIYFIYIRKLKKEITKIKHLREIENVRHGISIDIHDDIGSGLSKIAMITDMTQRDFQMNNLSEMEIKLKRLNTTAKEIIRSLGEIVWIMKPENDNLSSLLMYIRVYSNNYFDNSAVNLTLHFPEIIPDINIRSEARRNIILIIKESLHNCSKYANASEITIEFEHDNINFSFKITDNGIGIDAEKMSKLGNGLKNIKYRSNSIGIHSDIISSNGKGTCVSISGLFNKVKNKLNYD